jgi:transcriptional regulator with XRE-family HTH domain
MTQDQLARIVGVTQGYISQVVKGERRPGWPIAKILAYHTGTLVFLWMEGTEADKRAAVKSAGKERA